MERDDSRPNPPSSPGGRDEPEDSEALLGGPQHAPADEDDDSVHHDETIVSDEDDGTVTVVSKSLPLPLPNGSADTIGDELFEDLLKSAEILSSSDLADELEATVDAAPLSERLVSRGKLTPFQVAQVSEGRGPELKFGNYVLLDRLGQGGMGEVFSARHTRMKRVVAIKILPPRTTQSADSIERFHREVEAAAKLQHPNIVAAFDADETNGRHFLVMELVGGPDLSRYIAHQGALPPGVATRLMVQAARGLVHAHDRGVVHRDIKPGNLIVDKDGVLKILDMGLAQLTVNEQGGSDDLTQSGRLMGTVDFMAPEQAKDAKHVDHRADIYSLGCTLYFLLTGRPMSPPGSIANKLLWHQTSAPPSLLDSIESCPPELDALYLQMVAKSPADRPESMQLVVEKFEHLAQQTPAEYKSLPGAGIIVRQTDAEPTIRSPLPRATMVEQRAPNSGDTISDETARPPNRAAIGGAIAIAAVALISLFIWQPWKRATPQQDPTQGRPIAVAHPQADFISWVTSHGGAIGYVGEQGKRRVVRGGDGSSVPAAAVITLVDLDQVDIDADVLKSVRDSVSSTVTELRLSGCPVDNKSAAAIESLVELTVLDLSKTGIDNGILAALARLPKLRELRLVGCDVTDQGLAALASSPQLEILLLSDTPTGDAGLNALKPLESLRKLVVHGTRITESGRSGLLAANKSLEIAWDGVRADSRIASSLLAAGARLVVELPGGGEQAVRARADLPSDRFVVIAVDASGVKQFGDEQAQQLAGLAKLTSLKLQKTQVTPTGLAHLHGLVTLRDLDLGAMRIPAATLTQLSGALADCRIEHRDPPDDAIAKWLLSSGGGVTVRAADGSSHELQGGDSLPQGPFVVVAIEDAAEPGAEIAAQLSDLAQLQRISFREPVETAVAAGLSSLPHLSEVTLEVDAMPAELTKQLAELPKLTRLHLAGANLDAAVVRQLSRRQLLVQLGLDRCRGWTEALVKEVVELPHLKQLSLREAPIADALLPALTSRQNLVALNVQGAPLTDAGVEELRAALQDCVVSADPPSAQRLAARWLVMQGAALVIDGEPVGKLADLPRDECQVEEVNVADLIQLDAEQLLDHLVNCAQLKKLSAGKLRIADDQFARLKQLTALASVDLQSVPITDRGLVELRDLPRLAELNISGSLVTGSAFQQWTGPLQSLNAANTRFTASAVASLGRLGELQQLDLSGNREIGPAVGGLAGLTKLRSLSLRSCQVSDAALAQLAELTLLDTLDLDSNDVGDEGVGQLSKLPLRSLSLYRTKVTDSSLEWLSKKASLRKLNVSRTGVTDGGVESLRKQLKDCQVVYRESGPKDPTPIRD